MILRTDTMLIGLDFDNTIACYDALFYQVAREQDLIPSHVPANKAAVRDFLLRGGQEAAWTEIQGYVYGARLAEAVPFPGVSEFFTTCRAAGIPMRIISHKTPRPYLGPPYDLHAAAIAWLELQGYLDAGRVWLAA